MTGQALPLWRQLQAAASVLQSVREGASATAALTRIDGAVRPAAQALAFQTFRNLGRAEALRVLLAKRPPPPQADALLCVALALCWRDEDAPYEPFTLVDQAVEAAKLGSATRAQSNFINACLRRFLREREAMVAATDRNAVAFWNHPQWWINRLKKDHPDRWQQILEANNTQPPMTLRVNARRNTQEGYLASLLEAGVAAVPVGAQGVILERPRPVNDVPGFTDGHVSVQDAAAQLAAPLLMTGLESIDGAPLRVLDACAAPGGKTAHLLEISDAHVVALDIDAERCKRIHETLQRLGLQAEVVVADAANPPKWWDAKPFDAILLDAPCTASGIVRRHPDVRWLRRETDIAQLAALQARLLAVMWPLLRPGGRLLYCTCSVFRAEGEAQVQTFLARHKDSVLRPGPGHLVPQTGEKANGVPDNLAGDHDGFYYALFEKSASLGSHSSRP
ncbi:MAG: 16S rRNA (cytosine(967)-C(5))-methyltransferase RsmB [Pseudomonadota bacterium]